MIKSELVQKIAEENPHLYQRDVERLVEDRLMIQIKDWTENNNNQDMNRC